MTLVEEAHNPPARGALVLGKTLEGLDVDLSFL